VTSGGGGGCPRSAVTSDGGRSGHERERGRVCGWAGPRACARLWGLSLLISVG
jgi:hypothetical protein